MPTCKKCLKRISWRKSVMGKMIPIEEDKYLTCISDKDGTEDMKD
ncbi:hypothetical protein [Acetivibrio cellulolyticus]|nr:hypothetical protein [Acetivibrio cellulolyticus]